MHTIHGKKLLMLKPSQIKLSASHIRSHSDSSSLKSLAGSISKNGIIEPIAVRKSENGSFILIAGERRLRAAVMAGLRRIPCVLHKTDSITGVLYSITENIQREPLYFFDEAQSFDKIIRSRKISPMELSLELGIPEIYIHNKLRLLKLSPEIRSRIEYADLNEEYALLLLLLPEYQRAETLNEIITDSLSLSKTKELIDLRLSPKPKEEPPAEKEITHSEQKPIRKSSIGDLRLFGNSLNKLVETIKSSGITATVKKVENSKYIEYKVKIKKETNDNFEATQLKFLSV